MKLSKYVKSILSEMADELDRIAVENQGTADHEAVQCACADCAILAGVLRSNAIHAYLELSSKEALEKDNQDIPF